MSDTGKQSPLGINVLGSLMVPSTSPKAPIQINAVVSDFVGESKDYATYTKGTIISNTALDKLTEAINAAYVNGVIDEATYTDLINIGSTTIPALGNTPPPSYTYNGNTNPGSPDVQPPYPNPAGPTPTRTDYPTNYPWLPWNGAPTIAPGPPPEGLPPGQLGIHPYTQWGYIRLFALQAWNEFNWNGTQNASNVEYKNFCTAFAQITGFMESTNASINAVANSNNFLQGSFSNMNDMLTGDITGVSLSTVQFGQDLIALGKSLNLSTIASFGLPSNLLKTINQFNGISQSVSIALIASGLGPTEIKNILATSANVEQEQKIYGAFLIITGNDLREVLITLNCNTANLQSLADLLNIKKLFPNSYATLTVPLYNTVTVPSNSKTYYLIYENGGISARLSSPNVARQVGVIIPPGPPPIQAQTTLGTIQALRPGFDSYLTNILPPDQAIAAGAFSFSMQQIKNISDMPIEKFAQVVTNLETVRGLELLQGISVPVDPELASLASGNMSNGTGANGVYTLSDFFGCMSGLPYAWRDIEQYIKELQTTNLQTIYDNIYIECSAPLPNLAPLIVQANDEIQYILNKNPQKAKILNTLWNNTGIQLTSEQAARLTALQPVPVPQDDQLGASPDAQISFVDSIPEWSKNTLPHMHAQTLEAIADWTTIGGQSLVGMMREQRNKERLSQLGIPPSDNINDTLNPKQAQILLANGTSPTAKRGVEILGIGCDITANTIFTLPSSLQVKTIDQTIIPSPFGYFNPNDAEYYLTNSSIGGQGGTTSLGEYTVLGSLQNLSINNNTGNVLGPYCDGTGPDGAGTIQSIKVGAKISTGIGNPLDLGNPVEPGSLAGSEFKDTIPDNLNLAYTSGLLSPAAYNTDEAVQEVVRCNCDCWLE
jgi:hypothetical protein